MTASKLGSHVVRILCGNRPVGGGLLLDNEHILTCGYIIDKIDKIKEMQKDKPLDKICIEHMWSHDKKTIAATVLISLYDKGLEDLENDIAIIKLDQRLESVKPIKLILVNGLVGHNFCSYGFPMGHDKGIFTEGKIGWEHNGNRIILENYKNCKIPLQRGFSGCPVWDVSLKGIVGIIAATDEKNSMGTFISAKELTKSLEIKWPKIKDFVCEYTYDEPCSTSFSEEMHEILRPWDDIHNLFRNIDEISKSRMELFNSGAISEDDLKRLNCISKQITEKWREFREIYNFQSYKYIFNFPAYDEFHSINIERIMYKLLPKLFKKSWVEDNKVILFDRNNISFTFLLLASAWLHDIGMITSLLERKPSDKEEDIEKQYLDILNNHHEKSIEYISNNRDAFKLHDNEPEYLSDICKFHMHKDYSRLHECNKKLKDRGLRNRINIPLITSYLRLADSLQIPRKTTDIKSYMALGLDDSFVKFQWLKSQITADYDVDPDAFKVKIILKIPEKIYDDIKEKEDKEKEDKDIEAKKLEESVNNLRQSIEIELQNEIDCIKDIIVDGKIDFYLYAECKTEKCSKFNECSEKDFKELLNDIELFGPRMSPNASAVMGVVLKQIESILSGSDQRANLENLQNYNNTVLRRIKDKRPCHVFLHKVADFLTNSLSKKDQDCESTHRIINDKLSYWNEKIDSIKTALPDVAYGILADNKFSLLLYGYSSSIINCLEGAINKNDDLRNIEVYVCQAATKNELRYNNRLVYNDGLKYIHELRRLRMKKIYYITDVCPSHIFSEGKISKVLFGANGIEPDGSIHHTLGHLAIAEMAYMHGVWVFVVADSLKIGNIDASKLGGVRGNEWLTTDIDKEEILQSAEVNNYNPRGDKVSADLISAIVLEKGIIRPQDAEKYMDIS
ncbi:MAG: Ribose 1,5-bisphosphate isomerase [Methanosaeta sp. PtaB.Bin018]|nr:MAG: Ribose 1,5-bisphosphate isomerase [Methanosaeta sp. PtaB.Bin018]OPY45020.1 MAG: Ribose 1,5-bisphosphate isomerase [Methanosaeta sp. PtaU1.Bin016]